MLRAKGAGVCFATRTLFQNPFPDAFRKGIAMTRFIRPTPFRVALLALATLMGTSPRIVLSKSPVKLQNWKGTIDFSTDDMSTFTLAGTASHLGRFRAYGEIAFLPGEEEGSLNGDGVVVFEAANGDLLVGLVMWAAEAENDGLRTSHIHFSWRNSVQFSDGTVVANTGHFVNDRPPGLVVIAIIAILIGLLIPAVQ